MKIGLLHLLSCLLLTFTFLTSLAYNPKCISTNFDSSFCEKIVPNPKFSKMDAIILSQIIYAKLPSFENTEVLNTAKSSYILKKERVLLNTQNAVDKYSAIYLPESADALLDAGTKKFCYDFNDWYNIPPEYLVQLFEARVLKKDGTLSYLTHESKVEVDSIYLERITFPRVRTRHKLKGLEVGDELQYIYKIEIPYFSQSNFRFLFQSIYPIQNYQLTINYPSWIQTQNNFFNDAVSNYDSTRIVENKIEKTVFTWKRKDLFGYDYHHPNASINSISYAAIELFAGIKSSPILFTSRYNQFKIDVNTLNFNIKKLTPYYKERKYNAETIFRDCLFSGKYPVNPQTLLFYDYLGFKDTKDDKSYYLSKNNKSNVTYRHFYKKFILDSTYTNDNERMIALHLQLNSLSPCDYKSTQNDPHKLALTYYELFERNWFRCDFSSLIYYELFYRFDSVYYYSIFPDKRFSHFSPKQASVTLPSSNLFAFRIGNNFYYMVPQTPYSSYNLNELPFYFEDQLVVNIPQNLNALTKCSEIPTEAQAIYTYTPKSQMNENYRQITGSLKINMESNSLDFSGKISLSGQFSTLLRNYYTNKLIDPTINRNYKVRMSDLADLKTIQYKLISKSTDFPFKTYFSGVFTINKVIEEDNGIKKMNLAKWFHYVYPDSNFVNPQLHPFDYYPDFVNSDKFIYQLSFSSATDIVNINDFTIDLKNDYGEFHVRLKKVDDTNYIIDSHVNVMQDLVKATNLKNVEEITKAIDKFKSTELLLKKI